MAGRHLISEAGRAYRIEIVALLFNYPHTPLTGPLKLTIRAHRPDNRRRDIDNILKPLLDALAHAGIYEDDSQIHHLDILLCDKDPDQPRGAVSVTVSGPSFA
jgi:crossover junction endodeoxyribonuclease RusA